MPKNFLGEVINFTTLRSLNYIKKYNKKLFF